MYSVENTSIELKESKLDMAILPIGSIEQHGRHLPLGTDWMIAQEVSRRVASRVNGYLLPAMPFTSSSCHRGSVGTVWLRETTLLNFVKDIAESLSCGGFSKLVVINCHGGNWILKPAVREVNVDSPNIRVIMLSPWALAEEELKKIMETAASDDVHAGEGETSLMMYLCESLVRPGGTDYIPPVGREFLDYLSLMEISPSGVWGRPSKASGKKGEKAIEIMVSETARYIKQTFERIEKLRSS